MIGFLHTFVPRPEAISVGSITVYWYGLFIVAGASAALALALYISAKRGAGTDHVWNLALYCIFSGIVGSRFFYAVFYNFGYFRENPLDLFKVWEGGMSIHGGIIAGIAVLAAYSAKKRLSFWIFADVFAPAIALGQAIGRWGNYFNQELFGRPTDLPWGIPIDPANRPDAYAGFEFFHPAFLYESLWNLAIVGALLLLWKFYPAGKKEKGSVFLAYLALYSFGRFFIEFIRTDYQPEILGLRTGQALSLVVVAAAAVLFLRSKKKRARKENKQGEGAR